MPSGHVVRPSWPQGASVTIYWLPLENKWQLQTCPFKIRSSEVNKEWLLSTAEFRHYLPILLAPNHSPAISEQDAGLESVSSDELESSLSPCSGSKTAWPLPQHRQGSRHLKKAMICPWLGSSLSKLFSYHSSSSQPPGQVHGGSRATLNPSLPPISLTVPRALQVQAITYSD